MEVMTEEAKGAVGTDLLIDKVDVWATTLMDRPGGLAEKLEALKEAGADLQFVIARRAPEKPGGGVVFVTPLRGDREVEAASAEGFNVTRSLHSLRIEQLDMITDGGVGIERIGEVVELPLLGGHANL